MNTPSLKKYFLALLVVALIGGVFYMKVYLPKNSFASISPKLGDINETVFGVGTVEAKELMIIASKTPAKVASIFADQGDEVAQNKILATMDNLELTASKEEALMALQKSKLSYDAQKTLLADVNAKYTLAKITLKRYQNLARDGFLAQSELDSATATHQSAQAQWENAAIGLKVTQADIAKSEATLKTIEAKLEDLVLRSPINARVISRNAEIGSTVLAGAPIFRLVDPRFIWAKVYINERQSGAIAVGQPVFITLRSHANTPYLGQILRIGLENDRVTEEREVDISFETVPTSLYLGERLEATIHTASHRDILTIPLSAIHNIQGVKGVWVNKEGHAHFKPIFPFIISAEGVASAKGLDQNDIILLPNKQEIYEGKRLAL